MNLSNTSNNNNNLASVEFESKINSLQQPILHNGQLRTKEVVVLQDGLVWLRNWISLEIQKKMILHCIEFGEGKVEDVHGFHEGKLSTEFGHFNLTIPIDLFDSSFTDLCCIDYMETVIKACPSIPDISTPSRVALNYYTPQGKIGWHIDKVSGLSKEFNKKVTTPVVSVSLGDAAYFSYKNDMKDEEESIYLESGDIVVFGGPSRMVFHTVPKIVENTAPPEIAEIMKKFPGRFNLTFRSSQHFQ